jgi:hypothetical protein
MDGRAATFNFLHAATMTGSDRNNQFGVIGRARHLVSRTSSGRVDLWQGDLPHGAGRGVPFGFVPI